VLVDDKLQVLQFRGVTTAYLKAADDSANANVLEMAVEGLLRPLRDAIDEARQGNKVARRTDVHVRRHGKVLRVNFEVIPLRYARQRGFLILFQNAATSKPRDYLRSVHKELDKANEELRAANNEVRAANDWLQTANQELHDSMLALGDSDRRFRAMIDSLPAAVYTTDAKGYVTHVNPAAAKFAGRQPALGTDRWCVSWKLYQPDGTPMSHEACLMAVALREGRAIRGVEGIIERPDRSRRWFEAFPTPVLDERGKVVGGINVMVDITERKRAESLIQMQKAALEMVAQEEELDDVLAFLARGIEGQSLAGMWSAIHLFNPAGTHFALAVAPSLPATYTQLTQGMEIAPRTGPYCDVALGADVAIATDVESDPRWPPFTELARTCGIRSAWSTPIVSSRGNLIGTLAIYYRETGEPKATDRQLIDAVRHTIALIIEHKQAQDARRESEERFHSLVHATTSIVWTTDESGRFVTEQTSWSAYTGQQRDEYKDFGWTSALHPEDRDRVRAHWEESRAARMLYKSEGRLWHAGSESYRHFEARGVPVIGPDGSVHEWVGQHVDVEEQHQAEQRIYELMAELNEGARRKDEFIAMLAHELRGPLAPVANSLETLQRAQPNEQLVHEVRETLQRQVGHMVRLVDDLLDVGRITRDRLSLRMTNVELETAIRQAVEVVRPLADGLKHEISVTLPNAPIHLRGDPVRLTQVFGNLLNNACKFSEPGGHIRVTAERQGSEVAVSVADSGIGIPADQLDDVFAMFSQVDRSLERSRGGLGLGLTLVKQLVELHRGSVEGFSEGLGRGSTFVVRLPVTSKRRPKAPRRQQQLDERTLSARRILVVDDNPDTARALVRLLDVTGSKTRKASDGLEALQVAEEFRPEIVLLDLGLPKLSGFDVARRIREQPWGANMLLIALTGWGQEGDRRHSAQAGFDAHLVKPVDYGVLVDAVAGCRRG
jgi:PAS domain S-box-containing protein